MRENKRDFMTKVETACLQIRGLSEVLKCISSSEYFDNHFSSMFAMLADECEHISDLIDEANYTN